MCWVTGYILPVKRQHCALVRGGGGATTSQTRWPRGAAAGRERHFSANWRHRSPPAPDSSPRYTNTENRRNIRRSRPAGRRPAPSWPAWGAGFAPHPGSGRCRRCRPRWPAGRTPGCGGTRPPSLYSGWTRCCRSEKTWNNRVHLSDDYRMISEMINSLVTSVSAQWHFLFFLLGVFDDTGRQWHVGKMSFPPLIFSVWSLLFSSVGTTETAAENKDLSLYLESSECLNVCLHPNHPPLRNMFVLNCRWWKFVKWNERKILKVKKKLWHLIMAGTFSAEYYDVSVFNLWPHYLIHVRYAS